MGDGGRQAGLDAINKPPTHPSHPTAPPHQPTHPHELHQALHQQAAPLATTAPRRQQVCVEAGNGLVQCRG